MLTIVDALRGGAWSVPERLAEALNGRRGDVLARLAGIPVAVGHVTEKIRTEAGFEFQSTLRRLVDQWLATGKSDERGDDPWKRSVRLCTADSPDCIMDKLAAFMERNPPRFQMTEDDRFGITAEPRAMTPANTEQALQLARDWASYLFIQLLSSPARERLALCDNCHRYFVRKNMPKKGTPICRGTFCENCKNAGAAKRVISSRNQRTTDMVSWAAEAWPRWKSERRQGNREAWVAAQINMRLRGTENMVAKNWVTRHKSEIEAEVKRRSHAESKGT